MVVVVMMVVMMVVVMVVVMVHRLLRHGGAGHEHCGKGDVKQRLQHVRLLIGGVS